MLNLQQPFFVDCVEVKGCRLSMDGRGTWRDNVFIERVWRSVKYEYIYLYAYDSNTWTGIFRNGHIQIRIDYRWSILWLVVTLETGRLIK